MKLDTTTIHPYVTSETSKRMYEVASDIRTTEAELVKARQTYSRMLGKGLAEATTRWSERVDDLNEKVESLKKLHAELDEQSDAERQERATAEWLSVQEMAELLNEKLAERDLVVRCDRSGAQLHRTGDDWHDVHVYFPREDHVYTKESFGWTAKPSEVNWSSFGSQDPEKVRRYAEVLLAAADVAEFADEWFAEHIFKQEA